MDLNVIVLIDIRSIISFWLSEVFFLSKKYYVGLH